MDLLKSTPNIEEFVPLPQQLQIITDVRKRFNYSLGTHEVFLSGSVGSSKSLTLAHLIITHCLLYPGARVGIGRLALPQLKSTLCQKIKEHLFESGIEYKYYETNGNFDIASSKIQAVSWSDGNLTKLGSMEFSAFGIEELTETKDSGAYDVILQRTNRLPHIKEPWVCSASNPDGPSHWAYKKLIMSDSPKVHVYYSNTNDNPYLPSSYIETLKERLDEKMARRMIYGEWLDLDQEKLYYSYSSTNFKKESYKINLNYPIRLSWDFNIGDGKPLSLVLMQHDPARDEWHIFDEIIVDGQRTLDSCEELAERGFLDYPSIFLIHGDATGRSRDTRSIRSDYEIIENFMSNYQTKKGNKLRFRIDVPRGNPPIRERHNIMNGYMKNTNGSSKLFVYEKAKTVDEGFRLTKLRSGGQYLEDDKDRYQHCTTAVGYAVMFEYKRRLQAGPSYSQGVY